MTVSEGTYKDVNAVILETESMKVTVLPSWGSKTASIIHKPSSFELLWQNPDSVFQKTGYGDPYPKGDKSGFDEMFPAISRCFYEDPPWEGTEAPDHGEVWSIPWQYEISGEIFSLQVAGVRFPYTLKKEITLRKTTLHIEYTVTNNAPCPFRFIWAAHPLFNTCPGMEFRVPEGMDRIINAVPGDHLGGYGKILSFPECTGPDGKTRDLSRVPVKSEKGYQKYYFAGTVPEGWCELYNPEKDLTIRLSYPKEEVPYLGMWLNITGWADQYNIAPEPATAAMDRIDFSTMWDMGSFLEPLEERSWYLDIFVD